MSDAESSSPTGYAIADDDVSRDIEARRLAVLASGRDRGTAKLLTRLGVGPGMDCLEVGAGQGSIARWLAEVVGPDGSVLATDIDLQFVGDQPANVTVQRHDIAHDPLPGDAFDVVHARAVLQHVPERERALANMVAATRPGGWVVIEDIDWQVFDAQPLPEPFATLHHAVRDSHTAMAGYDGFWGRRMIPAFVDAGLVEVESRGSVGTMIGGTASAEWYILALERAKPRLVEAGLLDEATVDAALAQAREPSFRVLGPLGISAWGRKPLR